DGLFLAVLALGTGRAVVAHPPVRGAGNLGAHAVFLGARGHGLQRALREDAVLPVLAVGDARLAREHPRQGEGLHAPRSGDLYERAPVLQRALDKPLLPVVRLLHRLRLTPNQVSWASLVVTIVAALRIASGHITSGLALMAFGQVVDAMDGAMARIYQLSSKAGQRVDTLVDRLSETAIFIGFA